MNVIIKITRAIDRISDLIGKAAMYLALILLVVIVFEVLSRRLFNAPTIWTYEASTMLFGAFIMLIMPYGLLHEVNVSVDVITQRFSLKTQRIIDLVTYFVFFSPFVLILLYTGSQFALSSWEVRETSWSNWKPPLYYIKTCIPLGAFLTLLQGISEILKRVMVLMEGAPATPAPDVEEARHG
ncbi:MAG: TRAP transporter small permease subunit [Candidatus Adiutrix sp.]|jgi:TRAP-type mannitol/chloroaromatic compound transport system permease small subunit|nr:TRAP transporter small permease subunit [Candidatus Adiutrix sp.]